MARASAADPAVIMTTTSSTTRALLVILPSGFTMPFANLQNGRGFPEGVEPAQDREHRLDRHLIPLRRHGRQAATVAHPSPPADRLPRYRNRLRAARSYPPRRGDREPAGSDPRGVGS